jgi:hypothetical protein
MTSPPFPIIRDWTCQEREHLSSHKTIRKTTILVGLFNLICRFFQQMAIRKEAGWALWVGLAF